MASKEPKAGRPARKDIERIRTRVWVHNLMAVSGMATGYALECALQPELVKRGADGIKRPKKWDGYVKGTRSPLGRADKIPGTEIAEARFPGTRCVFDSPAWVYLSGAELDGRAADAAIGELGPDIVDIVLGPAAGRGGLPPEFTLERAARLANVATVGALLAVVLLVAKSAAIASTDLREKALKAYSLLQALLRLQPHVRDVASELFLAVDLRCKHWVHANNQTRLDIVIFSDEVRAALEQEGRASSMRLGETTSKTPDEDDSRPNYFNQDDV